MINRFLDLFGCLLGFHYWTRWFLTYDSTGHEWYQEKWCHKCNKHVTRDAIN